MIFLFFFHSSEERLGELRDCRDSNTSKNIHGKFFISDAFASAEQKKFDAV